MDGLSVSCNAQVRVTVDSPARHLCPFKDEVDHGNVRVEWTTSRGQTIELHTLAALIGRWANERISHEQWTSDLADVITVGANVDDLKVTSTWRTAGLKVSVTQDRRGARVPELFTDGEATPA